MSDSQVTEEMRAAAIAAAKADPQIAAMAGRGAGVFHALPSIVDVALRAALAGRTVLDPADNEYVMREFGLDIDYEAGGVYVSLNHNPVARTEPWGDDVNVDYDKDGTPIGVEILRPPRVSSKGGEPRG